MSKREKVMRASRNERTGTAVGSISAALLKQLENVPNATTFYATLASGRVIQLKAGTVKRIAASNLTQRPDRGPVLATARPKKPPKKKAGRVGRK